MEDSGKRKVWTAVIASAAVLFSILFFLPASAADILPSGSIGASTRILTAVLDENGSAVINEINFPDEMFRQYVSENFDADKDGVLTQAEREAVEKIGIIDKKSIQSLQGIECFPNLKQLDCSGTGIESLDVSQNPKLFSLSCYNTKITHLDVSQNPELLFLLCYNTEIGSLDVSQNSKLSYLNCSNTKISELNVTENKALQGLWCDDDKGIKELQLDNNTELLWLYCSNTSITKLDVSKLGKLKQLGCGNVKIAELDISQNPNLSHLSCPDTNISVLDISNAPLLENLACGNTGIKELSVSDKPELRLLQCQGCKGLTALDVSKNEKLEYLSCWSTDIEELDVSGKPNLETLWCRNTKITMLDVSMSPNLKWLYCDKTGITELDVSHNPLLEVLSCGDTGIKTLNVDNNPFLTTLACENTGISELHVKGNPALIYLECHHTGISSLDVSGNPGLTVLQCQDTSLAYLNLGTLNITGQTQLGEDKFQIPSKTSVNLQGITGNSFNITEVFPGIILEHISNLKGAELSDDGTVSGYSTGAPVTYTYDCGENSGKKEELKVTLYAGSEKETTTILFRNSLSLDKAYDGEPVSLGEDDFTVTGSKKPPVVIWEQQDGGIWRLLSSEPAEPGTYRVHVYVDGDEDFEAGESAPLQFVISENELKDRTLEIRRKLDKVYDGKPVELTEADLKFEGGGEISYEWRKSEDSERVQLESAPSEAGYYGVTVRVAPDGEYRGISASENFVISRAETTVRIKKDLDKSADGLPVTLERTDLDIQGSEGDLTIIWERETGYGWERMSDAPFEQGNYRVTVRVAADTNYNASEADAVQEFTIGRPKTVIQIKKELDKEYDGKPVALETSDLEITGSTGEVSFDWQKKGESGWEGLTDPPSEPGEYRVIVYVEDDEEYDGGESEPLEFVIREKGSRPDDGTTGGSTSGGAQSGGSTSGGAQSGSSTVAGSPAAVGNSPVQAVKAVLTGDENRLALSFAALLLSAGCMIFTLRRMRKQK